MEIKLEHPFKDECDANELCCVELLSSFCARLEYLAEQRAKSLISDTTADYETQREEIGGRG